MQLRDLGLHGPFGSGTRLSASLASALVCGLLAPAVLEAATPFSILELADNAPRMGFSNPRPMELDGWLQSNGKGGFLLSGEIAVETDGRTAISGATSADDLRTRTGPAVVHGMLRREKLDPVWRLAASRIELKQFDAASYPPAALADLPDETEPAGPGRKVHVLGAVRGNVIDGIAHVVSALPSMGSIGDWGGGPLAPPMLAEIWGRWRPFNDGFQSNHALVWDSVRVLHGEEAAATAKLRLPASLRGTVQLVPDSLFDKRKVRWLKAACWGAAAGLPAIVKGWAMPGGNRDGADAPLLVVDDVIELSRRSSVPTPSCSGACSVVAEGRLSLKRLGGSFELAATSLKLSPLDLSAYQPVTTNDLVSRPAKFNGNRVHLQGVYRWGFEVSTFDNELWFGPGQTLDWPAERGGQGAGDYPEARVETWGLFRAGRYGPQGQGSLAGHQTRFIEWVTPPRGR